MTKKTLEEVLELLKEIPDEAIDRQICVELILAAFGAGKQWKKNEDREAKRELKAALGFARVGRDAMRRG